MVAAALAQWVSDPLVVPYLPHLLIGVAAVVVLARTPGRYSGPANSTAPGDAGTARAEASRRWPPGRYVPGGSGWRWRRCSPLVFGSVSLAIVVLPEEVTSARSLSAGFACAMTALSFSAGVAVQPLARRMRDMLTGSVAGLGCATAGAAIGIAAVAC